MVTIKSGKDGNVMLVNSQGEALTKATIETELENASEEGEAYAWSSGDRDIDVGDTMLLVKNTSDTDLHITRCIVKGGNVATLYAIHLITADVTVAAGPGGALITGVNLNTGSAKVADASAAADESGNTQGAIIGNISVLPTTTFPYDLEGVILAKNKSVAVDQVTESTAGSAIFIGHYEVGE